MPLKLMYITNDPKVALIAESAGVDRIFVDMEYIKKQERQGGMDTVQSHHKIEDIKMIRDVIKKAEVLVRCNPIHDKTDNHGSSEEEINQIIDAGADIIMLPYFKEDKEVRDFIQFVGGRAKTILLVETAEAVDAIERILNFDGIDEVFIGLNDLSIGYHKNFMFELLADGTVEGLCKCFQKTGVPYGFGGLASMNKGLLAASYVIGEHYRLGSSSVILSRSFCNIKLMNNYEEIQNLFINGIKEIREYEKYCQKQNQAFFEQNRLVTIDMIKKISESYKQL